MCDDTEEDRVLIGRRELDRLLETVDQLAAERAALAVQIKTRRRVSRKSISRLEGVAAAVRWAVASARPALSEPTVH